MVCLASVGAAVPQGQRQPESYALAQCAVVQLGTAPRLYLTRPAGEVEAVDLGSGSVLWHTTHAAFPLMARGGRLLALLPAVSGRPGFRLGVLDARSGAILLRFPSWGTGSGSVGEGLGSSSIMEGLSTNGRDYVVWRRWWQRVSGKPQPTEIHLDSSAAEVNLLRGTLIPVSRGFPARSLRLRSDPIRPEPFEVAGITAVAATEQRGERFRIVLRRKRGEETLPDVVLCEPDVHDAFVDALVAVSADRRHVLGACQDSSTTPRYSYDIVVHSTVTGERVGHLISKGWPLSSVVWNGRLVYYFPERVDVGDLSTGRMLLERPLRDLSYRGEYPP